MAWYLVKTLVSAIIIVLVSELAKRNGVVGGLVKSLPLISLLSFMWVYLETKDSAKIADLSTSTLWFVIPTLPLFVVLPYLLHRGWGFWPALGLSIVVLFGC
jgi:hypothetical protein